MLKKLIMASTLACLSVMAYANDVKYLLTSHVLDTNAGTPATGVKVQLFKQNGNKWEELDTKATNDNGRIPNFLPQTDPKSGEGVYKLVFFTRDYYQQKGIHTIYPYVDVIFELKNDGRHYHIPLTLSPYSYSTYRGS
ncbi:hydroxyisourate hydrolase [Moraxella oblonga]|uniref:hydroxyisourate hydrolase n=1 Tax=Moraxella oblonga TaxID=200413 RepID=UPI000830E71F|nr:hydroxyisourate hydrolase [Moraxella oblonga]